MKGKAGIFLMTAGGLAVVSAVCLAVMNVSSDVSSTKKSADVLIQLESEIEQNTENISIEDNQNQSLKTVTIGDNTYAGIINIPAISIELPVMNVWDYEKLDVSPCIYYHDNQKTVIAAHNYSGHFGKIKELLPGDLIAFTDTGNNVKMYEVTETEVLGSHDTEKMVSGEDWDVTLFTCTLSGTQRVTVRARELTDY